MLNVTLFAKKDSPACDEARGFLAELQKQYPHRLAEVDVESDSAINMKYGRHVPVVEVGPYTLKNPISRQKLQMTLGAASDRIEQLEKLDDPIYKYKMEKSKTLSTGDRVSFWIARRYLLILNLFMLFYVGLPFLAPTLMNLGAESAGGVIYRIYKPLCHQFAFRSFFLYGEQPFYPLKEAGMSGYRTFEEATGIEGVDDPYSYTRFEARNFTGNETLGYKVALCERDVAIYLAILGFGIVFGLTGRRFKSVHWMVWLLLGIGPIGLDGFSQLFSQFNWDWLSAILPYRESTPFLRALTGAFFGLFTAWFAYPNIEESMNETRQYYIKKSAVIEAGG
ncbi:MAG: hypothetical protein DCC59_10390 [Chloroflexi bacterium]|nr:DUF2085 domain-containing protein [Chloroflexi bacterium CFX1]MCK6566842.1 DUF2085 domain-containing protein [Anaerolineales bacterium]MCQ3951868.1 hypothetical protein [Chloroflexota bacterium]MDL1917767.1 DUF2085 domain-containing protein [Chloroflexi bacterium CFX5]NUQ58321.1 DUF2085 domain-containing protein [Anaerolineales bacterium]